MASSSAPTTLPLTESLMRKLRPAKVFKDAVEPAPARSPGARQPALPRQITAICFDDRGDQLVTAGEDDVFHLYNCKTGKRTKTFYSKKYGIDLPRFTHKSTAIVYASTREDDTIRYHSLHDNKYLQYFRGHAARVVSLEMSAVDDGFMSASLDRTVRLWDLRAPQCRGLLHLPAPAVVAYDASGVVFAVGLAAHQRVLLYDAANFDRAPFLTIALDDPSLRALSYPPRPILMTSLAFSPSGRLLLAGCSGDAHYVLDSFEGHVLAKLEGAVGLERRAPGAPPPMVPEKGASGEEVAWTPDSKFVLGGGTDGRVHVWDMAVLPAEVDKDWAGPMLRLQPVANLDGHPGAARAVKFNPRFAMLASAGAELAFWLPDPSADHDEIARELLKKK